MAKSASLSDIAKAAGVSLTTASLVLNRTKQPNRVSAACSQRVRDIAQRLGYVPNYHARSMKLGRAETIAVVIDLGHDDSSPTSSALTDAYFNQLIGGIEMHLRSAGFQMTLIGPDATQRAPARGLAGIGQRRFDGMIVLGVGIAPEHEQLLVQSPPAPVVVVEYARQTRYPVIDYDEPFGVRLAVDHLAGLGHKGILWFGYDAWWESADIDNRQAMFLQACRATGITPTILRFPLPRTRVAVTRAYLADQAQAAMAAHLAKNPLDFTALLAYNDPLALGACGALSAGGIRIPDQVSIVGFDDIEAMLCIPRLTSVSHRLADMGTRAAEWILEMVNDPAAIDRLRGTSEALHPHLVQRKSTGPAPATTA